MTSLKVLIKFRNSDNNNVTESTKDLEPTSEKISKKIVANQRNIALSNGGLAR